MVALAYAPNNPPTGSVSAVDALGGVVRISSGGSYGTGVLLFDGRAVLTAAHIFKDPQRATVHFETASGCQLLVSERIIFHAGYDAVNYNNDLALVWLLEAAPREALRHGLYRASDEIGQRFELVGYGRPGLGDTGIDRSDSGAPIRQQASNQFDADVGSLKSQVNLSWAPLAGSQLLADFDNGQAAQDALGRLIGRSSTGLGREEGSLTPGDSGGPAFIGNQVAGIASYTATVNRGNIKPDVDTLLNSSFGELAIWQRVSHYQQWIDQTQRAQYRDAPTRADEVSTTVIEGDRGTTLTYFLLQFKGLRSEPQQRVSVDYATRDGSARAGEDYLPVNGTLVLYPGEDQAVIAVEILADTRAEGSENFFLDIFNPVGGRFGEGVIRLSAERTILDNDGAMWG